MAFYDYADTKRLVTGACALDVRYLVLVLLGVHTFCSHLAMRGATVKAIQELAGHADIRTTQQYMHLSPAAKDEAIALLNNRTEGTADQHSASDASI